MEGNSKMWPESIIFSSVYFSPVVYQKNERTEMQIAILFLSSKFLYNQRQTLSYCEVNITSAGCHHIPLT